MYISCRNHNDLIRDLSHSITKTDHWLPKPFCYSNRIFPDEIEAVIFKGKSGNVELKLWEAGSLKVFGRVLVVRDWSLRVRMGQLVGTVNLLPWCDQIDN
jgi:hypothetical protein